MSLQQGWHAIMRNKWKAVQILRGKDTTNTALRLKGFSFSSLGFTSLNIYLAFRYLYIFFGFLIHGTEHLGIVRACSNVTAHMCQTECGGDSSFRSSLWHQIQDCRQHGDPYFFRVQFIQKKIPFYLHSSVCFPNLWPFMFFNANVAWMSDSFHNEPFFTQLFAGNCFNRSSGPARDLSSLLSVCWICSTFPSLHL